MNRIKTIQAGSIAEEVEIEVGDSLLSINGRPVEDIIDYMFLLEDDYVELEIQKRNGDIWEIEIDKEPHETLGVTFDNAILDEAKRCSNNCLFCFVDQLPPGMRDSLYFKDDDSRLSFLQGNFVTLTNLDDEKLNRIIEYRISPINVSVHTTDPELRVKMLGNRFAGKIMEQLKQLTSNGIVVNAQIVLCPGYNDGDALDKTLSDLNTLGQNLNSVAVVPIGLTRHRVKLPEMKGFDKASAQKVIDRIGAVQDEMYLERGSRFVFAADEFYIKADKAFPPFDAYEGFLQYEDGVGMMRKLIDEVHEYLMSNQDLSQVNNAMTTDESRHVVIATGTAAAPFLEMLADEMMVKYPGLKIEVQGIINDFFGDQITVSGLITGQDIITQLKVDSDVETILIPINMLRSGERVLLDDITCEDLADHFGKPIHIVDTLGSDFVEGILNGGKDA